MKFFVKNLKEILNQEKKSISVNKKIHPTGTLATILIKLAMEGKTYVRFGYSLQTIFNHT